MVHRQRRGFGNGIRFSHRNVEFFGLQFVLGPFALKQFLGPAPPRSWSVPFWVFYLRRSAACLAVAFVVLDGRLLFGEGGFICGWSLLFASIRSLSRRRLGVGGCIRGSDLLFPARIFGSI
jgi:hypothetical protein